MTSSDDVAKFWSRANFRVQIAGVDLGCGEVRGLGSATTPLTPADPAPPTSASSQADLIEAPPPPPADGPILTSATAQGETLKALGGPAVLPPGVTALAWTLTPLSLRRAIDGDRTLLRWRANIVAGQADPRDVVIELLAAPAGAPVQVWLLRQAWPWSWSGPQLDAVISGVALEQAQLVYRSLHWLDNPQTQVLIWVLENACPVRYSGGPLNGRSSQIAIEELTIAYETLQLKAAAAS
jgi:hypothetical protein